MCQTILIFLSQLLHFFALVFGDTELVSESIPLDIRYFVSAKKLSQILSTLLCRLIIKHLRKGEQFTHIVTILILDVTIAQFSAKKTLYIYRVYPTEGNMGFWKDYKNEIIGGGIATAALVTAVATRKKTLLKLMTATELGFHCNVKRPEAIQAARVNSISLKKQPFSKDFAWLERKVFEKNVTYSAGLDNVRIFLPTIEGKKPACMLDCTNRDLYFLEKGQYSAAIDFIHTPFIDKVMNTYVLNRKEVMKIIEKNREIYTSRLGLAKDSSIETIYEKLKTELINNPVISDLEGLTLGFPKHNSMIFQLDREAGIAKLRKNPQEYRKKILETLHSENSPYKNLSPEEIKSLEETINKITNVQEFHNLMYDFIKFADEPAEFARIKESTDQYTDLLYHKLDLSA